MTRVDSPSFQRNPSRVTKNRESSGAIDSCHVITVSPIQVQSNALLTSALQSAHLCVAAVTVFLPSWILSIFPCSAARVCLSYTTFVCCSVMSTVRWCSWLCGIDLLFHMTKMMSRNYAKSHHVKK